MTDQSESWYWNWSWWNRQHPVAQSCPLIVGFPLDVRTLIWSNLNGHDRKSLKQVCKLFEFDVNQIVGVDAVLYGSKTFSEPSSIFSKAHSFLFGDADVKRTQANVNWIQNVLVRSLAIRQYSGIKCEICPSTLIKKLILLRSLSIEFDERQAFGSVKFVKEMLEQYNHLNQLSLEFTTFDFEKYRKIYHLYSSVVSEISELVFNSLEFKSNISELSLKFCFPETRFVFIPNEFYTEMVFRIIGTVPDDPPVLETWLQNPPKLTKIDIEMPSLPIDHLRRWKKFIDGQDRLTHLKINFGHVHWNFFTTVLRKCVGSLEVMDLVLINYYAGNQRPDAPRFNPVPKDQWFNWNLISPPNSKLKSIRIRTLCSGMEGNGMGKINDTINFDRLTLLGNLDHLSLFGIYLSETQLEIIFNDLKTLRQVELVCWTKVSEALVPHDNNEDDDGIDVLPLPYDYTGRNQHLCNLLNQVLPFNRLATIKLIDLSLYLCSEELRQAILDQPSESPYIFTWPVFLNEGPYAAFQRYIQCPLTIKQN